MIQRDTSKQVAPQPDWVCAGKNTTTVEVCS